MSLYGFYGSFEEYRTLPLFNDIDNLDLKVELPFMENPFLSKLELPNLAYSLRNALSGGVLCISTSEWVLCFAHCSLVEMSFSTF